MHALLRAVMLDNADAILMVDEAGIILAANPAAAVLFARPMRELVGSAFGHPVASDIREEVEVIAGDGRVHHVEMHAGATVWRSSPASIVTLRNVTERHRSEQALKDYVSMTAHEIATPLASICGFAETLENSWVELQPEQRQQFAGIISRQSKRVSEISRDLLNLARLDADAVVRSPVLLPVADIVEELLDDGLLDRAEVTVDIDDDLRVFADVSHASTVLRNLASNAAKYGEAPFVVTGRAIDGNAVIEVANGGPQVPDEFVSHLFERFARAEATSRRDGTGLGLALSLSLAALNGGALDHRHGDDGGAVFTLTLPRSLPVEARQS